MAKSKSLALRIVLDTNALYTGSASYFVRKEVAELIAQHKGLPDLRLSWHVPSVVKDERHFQMLTEARRFLEPIAKLERLLGHQLNITLDILETRVREAIDRQTSEHGIVVLPFDPAAVDWPRLVADAAFRRPPFQPGDKEKGFRDAVILESFLQLKQSSPTSASVCRVVLVTGDELLQSAAVSRTSDASNVHILDSIDALKGLINTLGSTADEQFIATLQPKAAKLFYVASDETTLYYKWDIYNRLKNAVAKGAFGLPAGADKYAVEKWTINQPRFVKKQGQRVSWATRFSARLKATKAVDYVSAWQSPTQFLIPPGSEQGLILSPAQGSAVTIDPTLKTPIFKWPQASEGSTFLSSSYTMPEARTVGFGTATVDVTWSVSVTTAGTLKSPDFEGVTFVDAIWE